MHDYQTTLKSRVTLSGIGVHSGKEVSIHFLPADADTGVVFHMMEGAEPGKEVRALVSEVGATDLCTMLGDPAGQHIATVEHLMAAVFGLGIDNLLIEIDGNEVPILDGSATPFVEAFDQVGIERLSVKRRYIRGQAGAHRERRLLGRVPALCRHAFRDRDRFREPGDRPAALRLRHERRHLPPRYRARAPSASSRMSSGCGRRAMRSARRWRTRW